MKQSLITKEAADALNKLAYLEMFNSYLYKSLAIKCQMVGLFGAEKFFKSESADEITHYQDVVDFANTRGVQIELENIDAPPSAPETLPDMLDAAYKQEVFTEKAYKQFIKDHGDDPVCMQFGLEVLEHQYQSVGEYADLIVRTALTKEIILIDQELGK